MRRPLIFFFISIFIISQFLTESVFAYTTNMNASVVVGKPTFTSPADFTASATNLYGVSDMAISGTKFIVADCNHNRVLIYNTIPTANGAAANVVVGQVNMTSSTSNQGGTVGANTLSCPGGVLVVGDKLLIADSGNHRVLIYNTIPTSNNASANVVIGQANMTTGTANQGGAVGANTLNGPGGLDYDSSTGKLFVTDSFNNRVLIYNAIPTANNAAANVVVGQADMTGSAFNQGGAISANGFDAPYDVAVTGKTLLIADSSNSRILIYNSIPIANNASANVVIGQVDMISGSVNQGGAVGANTLNESTSVFSDGTKVFIADVTNNRVLIYNSIPTSNNASADVVIGQTNFTGSSANQGSATPGANTLFNPSYVITSGSTMFIADDQNGRVLLYEDVAVTPTPSSGTSAPTSVSPSSCGATAPHSSPNLFQIDVKDTSATLYFAPVAGPVNRYFIAYGYTPGDERFGVEFSQGASTGVVAYTVGYLSPNSTYYFRVRGGNGCQPGAWGNEMKIRTEKKGTSLIRTFYKNFPSRIAGRRL